ncbi:MAG TPA: hypothetical protein PLK94_15010 [Alphaproteobacteria bacterium]|nr:hypothetical protein [Alphaproteobacteria bacterium]
MDDFGKSAQCGLNVASPAKVTKIKIIGKCGVGDICPIEKGKTTYKALLRNAIFCHVQLSDDNIPTLSELVRDELTEVKRPYGTHLLFRQDFPSITVELPQNANATIEASVEIEGKIDYMEITRSFCF